eukprot:gene17095-30027_t
MQAAPVATADVPATIDPVASAETATEDTPAAEKAWGDYDRDEEGYEEIMRTPIVRSFDDAERNIKIGESSKRDENGRIPLWIAANLGNFGHLMLYLKGAGVDPNTIDNEGRTPLWIACNLGRDKCVRGLLSDARTDFNAVNLERGLIVEMLLKMPGIDVNVRDLKGMSALWLASNQGISARVELLLQNE